MSETRMHVPAPPQLDLARLRDPVYTMRATGSAGPVLVHFDPAQHAGALCFLLTEVWAVYGPLPFSEFVATLGERGIVMPDGDDLVRWVTACSPAPTVSN